MKTIIYAIMLICICSTNTFSQQLQVNDSQRYLETNEGKPFLWIGDTAWELFHKLNREEAVEYLGNRAAKGFSVIQAVVLAENNGLRTPNAYGDVPLIDLDPTQPNDAYFEHVDFIVNKAEELGLVIGMLPTWGDKIESANPGAGPEVFTIENAATFGEFLGERYKNKPVVWILGGDRNVLNKQVYQIWNSMARGLKKGDGGNHLISYHPRGGSHSAYFFHNAEWLDFNMYQSGHGSKFNNVYDYASYLMLLHPKKPFVEGEPAYEDIAIKFWEYMDFSKHSEKRVPEGVLNEDGLIKDRSHFKDGFFDAYDIRVHAYWNFLSGACGYTYGNNAIWQMFKKGGEIAIPCLYDWRESMDRPGAFDMLHLREIMEDRFDKLITDQSFVYGINPKGENYIAAAGSTDNSFAMIYLAKGQSVKIVMNKLNGNVEATWFNPRNGNLKQIGLLKNEGIKDFTPPSSGNGYDWLLLLETK
ncbi:glycoside hydrolase family 140 protein [uncultured Draconibacterium sp.]|uniref:glycoside hydrolase family 140 protein n=1 Tax=uncultured Draconibacterium sp. TaxID=1573823 RepID=UPI0029C819B5|nr:glycoside hydrolase family 140 protein [uncultured Draconibacterium sp.]